MLYLVRKWRLMPPTSQGKTVRASLTPITFRGKERYLSTGHNLHVICQQPILRRAPALRLLVQPEASPSPPAGRELHHISAFPSTKYKPKCVTPSRQVLLSGDFVPHLAHGKVVSRPLRLQRSHGSTSNLAARGSLSFQLWLRRGGESLASEYTQSAVTVEVLEANGLETVRLGPWRRWVRMSVLVAVRR